MLEVAPDIERELHKRAASTGMSTDDLLYVLLFPSQSTDSQVRAKALIAQWQEEDGTYVSDFISDTGNRTTSEVLFAKWAEEDSALSEKERQEQEELWQQFQQGMNETRANQSMRSIF